MAPPFAPHELTTLYGLASALAAPRATGDTLGELARLLARGTGCDVVVVYVADGQGALRPRAAHGSEPGAIPPLRATRARAKARRLGPRALARLGVPGQRAGVRVRLDGSAGAVGALVLARAGDDVPDSAVRIAREIAGPLARRLDPMRVHTELAGVPLATAIRQIGDAVEIVDARGGFEFVNPAWERLTGYSLAEAVGRTPRQLLRSAAHSDAYLDDIWRVVSAGETWTGRVVSRRRTGEPIETDLCVSPIRDAQGHVTHFVGVRRDLTERLGLAAALRESEERFAVAALGANDGLWHWKVDAEEAYFSSRWKELLGYAPHEIPPRLDAWLDRVHPDDAPAVRSALLAHIQRGAGPLAAEHRVRRRDGTWGWVLARGQAFHDDDGRPIRIAGSLTDIGDRKSTEAKLVSLSRTDALTGLLNRRCFLETLQATLDAGPAAWALLFLDVDRFKQVNDGLGHHVGDAVLVHIAAALRHTLRQGDVAARIAGDEFAVLLPGASRDQACLVANRVLAALPSPARVAGHEVFVRASIGVAVGYPTYRAAEDVLRDADAAMYRAKAAGRSTVRVFEPSDGTAAAHVHEIEADLHHALARGEIEAHYQPIVSLATGEIEGFEALARWRHPRRGWVSPGEFVPVAEECGLIRSVWATLLAQVARQLACWRAEGFEWWVSVNVSPRQLGDDAFVRDIDRALAAHGLPPEALHVEITENALMNSLETAAELLQRLRERGIAVALDDFGTGWSSLSYLVRFPVQVLKIDRSFVAKMECGEKERAIVGAIVALARHLGLGIVAEGVEREGQVGILLELGAGQAQGWYFGAATPADQVPARARSRDAAS
ncbi:MAG: EAL domain-containing protein [Myxococcota bacterium]